jgi:predicted transcriptional regulator
VISPLSPELHALLESKLDTFEKLEVVLTLRAAGRPMSLNEVAHELQVGPEALQRVTDSVVASGIIVRSEDDLFALRSGPWDVLVDEAARLHQRQPQQLMRALTRIAMERIRGMSARTFADAFRIRKKGD